MMHSDQSHHLIMPIIPRRHYMRTYNPHRLMIMLIWQAMLMLQVQLVFALPIVCRMGVIDVGAGRVAGDGALRIVQRLASGVASQPFQAKHVSSASMLSSRLPSNGKARKKKKKKVEGVGGNVFDGDTIDPESSSNIFRLWKMRERRTERNSKRSKEKQVWAALSNLENDSKCCDSPTGCVNSYSVMMWYSFSPHGLKNHRHNDVI